MRCIAILTLILGLAWAELPSTTVLADDRADCVVVVWHALGSNCCEGFTKEFIEMLQKEMPGARIVSVRVGSTPNEDAHRSYFDNANRQVHEVCENLKRDPLLKDGFNAVGLSQGGLLMRAVVERCTGLKVNRLVTFGSPLQGVAAYPGCGGPSGWAKFSPWRIARAVFRTARERLVPCSVLQRVVGPSAYTRAAQNTVMPAQYYKDPRRLAQYLEMNSFLADINNERGQRNAQYRENMMKLNKMIIYHFEEEEVVYPQESTNFGYYEGEKILPMRELPIYKEDWIGLKELDKRKAIVQIKLPGEHVQPDLHH